MGCFRVFGAGGGGFNGVLQPEALTGWETGFFPLGFPGAVAVLPLGPHRDEPAGTGHGRGGFHSDLPDLPEAEQPPSLTLPGLAGACMFS